MGDLEKDTPFPYTYSELMNKFPDVIYFWDFNEKIPWPLSLERDLPSPLCAWKKNNLHFILLIPIIVIT